MGKDGALALQESLEGRGQEGALTYTQSGGTGGERYRGLQVDHGAGASWTALLRVTT